jgi:DNA processing protein
MRDMMHPAYDPISPLKEMSAYEALWDSPEMTFKNIADQLKLIPHRLPSEIIETQSFDKYRDHLKDVIDKLPGFGIHVHGDAEYPTRLRDARHPVELLYYQGDWTLLELPGIAVVGTRNPTHDGVVRAKRLVSSLVKDGFVIVSGLAQGIDTVAHRAAIDNQGKTIAVIGTPLNSYYPPENKELQKQIASHFLLISQVPFCRYSRQTYKMNRFFFPERNATMSALSLATVIVEAGETSGTLHQARAAIEQGRKLFILDNCFRDATLSWPTRFEKKGAIRIRDYDDLRKHLLSASMPH